MSKEKNKDGYGALLLSAYKTGGQGVFEIAERIDGFIAASSWPPRYFSEYSSWSKRERQAIKLAKGRVLDIGCGAGRFSLHLQQKGFDITGIDISKGAVKVCELRGVKNVRLMSIDEIGKFKPGSFDTVIMMGNNFGLFGGFKKAKRLLKQLHTITSADGQIIAETVDPYQTNDPLHLAYQRRNRAQGRMSGQLRIRIRHQNAIGAWFDYLLVSQQEMKTILAGTGWQISKVLPDKGPGYTAIITKTR
ncbi:MAG TPA: methyltransferase domain-containing protein [Candidatus Angelobacter sp.]|nr:methyltransferase domain-containing protein [Candidatus Angelobacter sp.]